MSTTTCRLSYEISRDTGSKISTKQYASLVPINTKRVPISTIYYQNAVKFCLAAFFVIPCIEISKTRLPVAIIFNLLNNKNYDNRFFSNRPDVQRHAEPEREQSHHRRPAPEGRSRRQGAYPSARTAERLHRHDRVQRHQDRRAPSDLVHLGAEHPYQGHQPGYVQSPARQVCAARPRDQSPPCRDERCRQVPRTAVRRLRLDQARLHHRLRVVV